MIKGTLCQSFTYDPSGRITQVKRAKDAGSAAWVTMSATYTATGRVAKIVDPDLDEDNFAYDERDWLTSATDGEGRVTAYAYDAAGRLTCEKRGVGTPLAQSYRSLAYGIFDSPARLRPAKGSDAACATASAAYDTIYAFDEYGRDKTTTFADGTTSQATLNVASEITALKTRANQTLGYSYDASSRETARTTPTGAYAFAYDREGKRTSAGFTPSGGTARTTTYTYDNYGRVTTEGRHDGKNIQYEYHPAGNRTAIQWPDAYRAEYIYDALNRPIEVKAGPTGSVATIARYSYDFLGRRTQLAFGPTSGSPVSAMTYGYEDDNDLVRLEHRFNSGALVKVIRHAYDKSGKLKSSATNDSAWAPLPPVATPDNRTYSANVLDQYTSLTVAGSATTSIAYDANGNLTSDGTWTFAYDAENHLLSANKAGAAVTYTYDALGRRQTKTVNGTLTNYLSAGDEEIAEYDASGNMLRRYIPGPGTDQPVAMVTVSGSTNTIRFFHADRQGSVVAMADTTGALVEGPYTYDPYGISASSTAGVPFRYTGRRLDAETGLYYYRARYYSATFGRFLQTDPVGYEDQLNSYAYVGNDPLNKRDPNGDYSRGTGWKDEEWQKFDEAQNKAADAMEANAEKWERTAQDSRRAGRPDMAKKEEQRAQRLRAGVTDLRGDKPADLLSRGEMARNGAGANSPAGTYRDRHGIMVSRDHREFGLWQAGGFWQQGNYAFFIGHESLHSGADMHDQEWTNGQVAYKFGLPGQRDAFRAMRRSWQSWDNPDHLMEDALPGVEPL